MLSFADDRWRYRGGLAKADVNLDFYGVGGDLGTGDRKIGYNLDGWVSSQQVLRRLGRSNQYLALRWIYLDLDSHFDTDRQAPVLEDKQLSKRSSGIGLSWEFDTRDNIFTPSRGLIAAVETLFYEPGWGSDTSFQTYRARIFGYLPLGKKIVLGARLDGRAARGDVPFYQLPYIAIRGIPALRYQDDNVAVAETEVRWNLTPRWALIGFIGAGRAWGRDVEFGDAASEVAKGGGFRYLIARRLGLYVGADYGRGPDDDAFYLQVGSAWR
jgi:outer membrane protein assembly factor BamA